MYVKCRQDLPKLKIKALLHLRMQKRRKPSFNKIVQMYHYLNEVGIDYSEFDLWFQLKLWKPLLIFLRKILMVEKRREKNFVKKRVDLLKSKC